MNLADKTALVTGGSRGIGKAISLALAKAGANVALTYNTNENLAAKVEKSIIEDNGKAIAVQMSVENRTSVNKTINEVKNSLGSIDILINNAAIAQEKPFDTITDTDWNSMLAVNLRGPFVCCQEVLPEMVQKGWGRIINITSIGGQWGGFNQVHYSSAKAGLISLTRSLAKIYSCHGITTNAVSPGLVETDMSSREIKSKSGSEKIRNIPIGRIATVDEIAQVVVFLASDEASYITGQTTNVNGGMYFG
jgi:NAD(P)-dependent dehydrogenase (short-subunit alcohol dehydrogenase family)